MIGLIKEHTGSFSWGLYFVAALLVVSSFIVFLLSGKAPERPLDAPLTHREHH